jgi:hypothetical protein
MTRPKDLPPDPRTKIDTEDFIAMWLAGASTADICLRFDVTANYVSDKGKLLGLPKRTGKVRPRPKVVEVKPEPPVKIRADRTLPPGWTEQMDVSLALTRGKYAQLEEVAVKYHIPVQRAVARFLQVRA